MTQVLTAIGRLGIVQIADRLTSIRGVPFDTESNKTIVFGARDAIVCLAYAGPSFIDRIPTDQWLAHVVRGEDPTKPDEHDLGAMSGTPPAKFVSVGQCLRELVEKLNQTKIVGRIEICAAGVQWHVRAAKREIPSS